MLKAKAPRGPQKTSEFCATLNKDCQTTSPSERRPDKLSTPIAKHITGRGSVWLSWERVNFSGKIRILATGTDNILPVAPTPLVSLPEFTCVSQLIHTHHTDSHVSQFVRMRNRTHSCVWLISIMCTRQLIRVCKHTQFIDKCHTAHSYVQHNPLTCDSTHWYVLHNTIGTLDSFHSWMSLVMTRLNHTSDRTHTKKSGHTFQPYLYKSTCSVSTRTYAFLQRKALHSLPQSVSYKNSDNFIQTKLAPFQGRACNPGRVSMMHCRMRSTAAHLITFHCSTLVNVPEGITP